mmetsp:Transcript_6450/g.26261  ORF Transcript_6450/g.26261 Transcript_6450/m.26261 type:complete len:244 (-) Transcript_6450:558-1289(-)
MSRMHSPTDAPAAIRSLSFRTVPSCLRRIDIVLSTAHRTSLSLFFCENASARSIPSSCLTSATPPSANPYATYSIPMPASATQLNRPNDPLVIFPLATSAWNAPSQKAQPAWTLSAPYSLYASALDSVYPFGSMPMRYATRKCAASWSRSRATYVWLVACANVSSASASIPPANATWSVASAAAPAANTPVTCAPDGCDDSTHAPTETSATRPITSRRPDMVLSVGDRSFSASMPFSLSSERA